MESQARKKFAKPPVKLACLSCRNSRIRCDGKQDCANCLDKGKECQYTRSRRGGPRVPLHGRRAKGKPRIPTTEILEQRSSLSVEDQYFQAAGLGLPNAGLQQLDPFTSDNARFLESVADSEVPFFGIDHLNLDQLNQDFPDLQFDNTLEDSGSSVWDGITGASLTSGSDDVSSDVRSYESDADLLDAYYVYCHAYFPVLPPPIRSPVDRPVALGSLAGRYGPTTPLTLAISAILALIPLPDDPDPKGEKSTWNRRVQAHNFAQAAYEALDNETELVDSIINPKDALSNGNFHSLRAPFHHDLPLDLEANVAYMLLSVYEYGQRGNIKKMSNRSGQSLMLALNAKLYSPKVDQFVEARRRVWWATYINVCEVATLCYAEPAIDVHDPKFMLPYPTIAADPEAFPFFIQCQQMILDAAKYAKDLNRVVDSGGDLSVLYMRTLEIESRLESLVQISDAWFDKTLCNTPVASNEGVVAKTLRSIGRIKLSSARIKVHRYSAFMNTPIFSKMHCGLQPVTPAGTPAPTSAPHNGQSQDTANQLDLGQMGNCQTGINTARMSPRVPSPPADSKLPFNTTYSTNVSRKAALTIAETLNAIPYPNPSGVVDASGILSIPQSSLPPRSMPTFLCCAVMGAYVLTMLMYKLREGQLQSPNPDINLALSAYEDSLRQGLGRIVNGLENFANAFEAIDGMREEVAKAFRVSLSKSMSEPNNRADWNVYYG